MTNIYEIKQVFPERPPPWAKKTTSTHGENVIDSFFERSWYFLNVSLLEAVLRGRQLYCTLKLHRLYVWQVKAKPIFSAVYGAHSRSLRILQTCNQLYLPFLPGCWQGKIWFTYIYHNVIWKILGLKCMCENTLRCSQVMQLTFEPNSLREDVFSAVFISGKLVSILIYT